jgi:PhoPQ-activated pathogenicity-related protein
MLMSFCLLLLCLVLFIGQVQSLTITDGIWATSDPSLLFGCEGFECVKQYVELPDDHYSWNFTSEMKGQLHNSISWTGQVLTMTSQRWLAGGATPEVWTHPVTIITPSNLKVVETKSFVTLIIGGAALTYEELLTTGIHGNDPDVSAAINVATSTGSIAAVVGLVPEQKLQFAADPSGRERIEDEIKAFTWRQFIDHQDHPEWPIELPMVKAVVRAMDTVSAVIGHPVQFIATGCSKRGMASIMTAAYDERVIAYAPCVISLDSNQVLHRFVESFGPNTFPVAMKDYADNSVPDSLDTPQMEKLFAETDPIHFLERLKDKAVMWMHVGRDDFFTPDHTKAFWSKLPSSPKLLSIDGNQFHIGSLSQSKLFIEALQSFVSSVTMNQSPPVLDWSFDNSTGVLEARLLEGPRPRTVKLWTAATCGTGGHRDFRMYTLDPPSRCTACGVFLGGRCLKLFGGGYDSRDLNEFSDNRWKATVDVPEDGNFVAFFIEFEFEGFGDTDSWKLSTEEIVLPLKYPFPPCFGSDCHAAQLAL